MLTIIIIIINIGLVMMNQINIDFYKMIKSVPEGSVKCSRCGWSWKPRKEAPRACPKCKSYNWRVEKIK